MKCLFYKNNINSYFLFYIKLSKQKLPYDRCNLSFSLKKKIEYYMRVYMYRKIILYLTIITFKLIYKAILNPIIIYTLSHSALLNDSLPYFTTVVLQMAGQTISIIGGRDNRTGTICSVNSV